jgi:hypothetical protein
MAPTWDTQTRGQNRAEDSTEYETDYDALSDADFEGLPGHGMRDVEDLTMLSGLQAQHETEP